MSIPPRAPQRGLNALLATVTTPPPSGFRQLISTYFSASKTKPTVTIATKSGAYWPTCS
jgi:hypothetical protein